MNLPRLSVPGWRGGANAVHLADALRSNTGGGVAMLIAAGLALVWAGLSQDSYQAVVGWRLGPFTTGEWASEGLLTIFFFVAGLELKREFTEGALRQPSAAIAPVAAALLGMAFPAGLYLLVNFLGSGQTSGWSIPMATDIAFALAVLAIAGRHTPPSLRAFLLTLAIVDDLGSILVIAVVFTGSIVWAWLAAALACMLAWGIGQRCRIDNGWLYIPLGVLTWWCLLRSGVHPTLAGVSLGLLTRNTEKALDEPLDRWKHRVEPWSSGLVVPLFALLAAGVHIDARLLRDVWTSPVPLGIIAGLVLGKVLGIASGTLLSVRLTGATLGRGIGRMDLLALAQLGGVGLTVCLMLCELSFHDNPLLRDEAKAAVLVASVIASVLAAAWLHLAGALRHNPVASGPGESH